MSISDDDRKTCENFNSSKLNRTYYHLSRDVTLRLTEQVLVEAVN